MFGLGLANGMQSAGTKLSARLHVAPAEVTEGQALVFSISLRNGDGLSFPLTVDWETLNGTALPGTHYGQQGNAAQLSGQVQLSDTDDTATVSVPTLDDGLYDVDRTMVLRAVSPQVQYAAQAVGLIQNVQPLPTISVAAAQALESAGSISATVTRTGGSAIDVAVDWRSVNGSAEAGTDFGSAGDTSPVSGQVVIPASAGNATASAGPVPLIDDAVVGVSRDFTLQISNPVNAQLGTSLALLTILEDDVPHGISVADAVTSPSEGAIDVAVTAAGGNVPCVVNVSTLDASALAGVDYTAVDQDLSFGAGGGTQSVSVPILPGAAPGTSFLVDAQPAGDEPGNAQIDDGVAQVQILADEQTLGYWAIAAANTGTNAFSAPANAAGAADGALASLVQPSLASRNGTLQLTFNPADFDTIAAAQLTVHYSTGGMTGNETVTLEWRPNSGAAWAPLATHVANVNRLAGHAFDLGAVDPSTLDDAQFRCVADFPTDVDESRVDVDAAQLIITGRPAP